MWIILNLPARCFWAGKSVGGCHLLANGTALNMGFVSGPPVVVDGNTLVVRYKRGDVCSVHSTPQLHRSTTIMFQCSLQQVYVLDKLITTVGLSLLSG